MRITGDSEMESEWYGPHETMAGKVSVYRPALLVGKTKKFDALGKYRSDFGHGTRDLSGRMTALITEIRTWDGKKTVPVCGVLFGNDGKEGVPIFRSSDGKEFGGSWGNAWVKFFWPK